MRLENSFVLFPRIGEKTEQRLWQAGVTHWDGLPAADAVGERTRERAAAMLDKARTNLDVGNSHFFAHHLPSGAVWRLYRNFRDTSCFFDIETTGLDQSRHDVTTVSMHEDGDTVTLVQGQDLSGERLAERLNRADLLVTFNGKRFDVPFLEHSFDLDIDTPHIDLMYLCKRLGLTGGLKQVERDLGINRAEEDIDGREAVRLWKQYEQGDEAALDTLVRYNRDDAVNLQQLLETVHKQLRQEVFEPHVPEEAG